MTRRRMMMQAANSNAAKLEYIYNAADGIYPEDTGEWTFIAGSYFTSTEANSRNLNNDILNVKVKNLSATQHYYPINNTADKCEIEVHFALADINNFNGTLCTVMLSDGENMTMAAITQKLIRIGDRCKQLNVGALSTATDKFNTAFDATAEPFVFKVHKDNDKAFIYINDELIYTQTELFKCSSLLSTESNGIIGTQAKPYTTVRLGGGSSCSIEKIIYREW